MSDSDDISAIKKDIAEIRESVNGIERQLNDINTKFEKTSSRSGVDSVNTLSIFMVSVMLSGVGLMASNNSEYVSSGRTIAIVGLVGWLILLIFWVGWSWKSRVFLAIGFVLMPLGVALSVMNVWQLALWVLAVPGYCMIFITLIVILVKNRGQSKKACSE